MRKSLRAALGAVAGIVYATSASAAAWTPPANVRVVQKDTTSTRVYTSIGAALQSIPLRGQPGAPSDANPYLVKVMPGVYNETVRMREFVDVTGSGPENTVILGATTSISSECDNAVVMMANNSTLRQVKVLNRVVDPSAGGSHANAVAFSGVSGKVEFVEAMSVYPAGAATASWSRRIGFCVDSAGGEASAELVHVYAEGNNLGGQGNGIRVDDAARVSVTDSRVVGTSDTDSGYPINASGDAGSITVNDTRLEAVSGTGDACGVWASGHETNVSNSRISVTGGSWPCGFWSDRSITMTNSTIAVSSGAPLTYNVNGSVRVASSQLPGDRQTLVDVGATLVGCYDENFRPIANLPAAP